MKKVAVLMSGGVDSSLSAALLQQQGFEILGITFRVFQFSSKKPYSSHLGARHAVPLHYQSSSKEPYLSPEEDSPVQKARDVAEHLKVPHFVLDIEEEFRQEVIQPFEQAYQQGLTPNPCVECNRRIKFGFLLKKAIELGAGSIATGHYAQIVQEDSSYHLKKGIDPVKDQSYFLYAIKCENLPFIRFPLGQLHKSDAKKLVQELNLPVIIRNESQDVCFLSGRDYRDGLGQGQEGWIKDRSGRLLGRHSGIENFTVGQRKGIGLSGGPFFVLEIQPASRTLIVGSREEGMHRGLIARSAKWLESVEEGRKVEVKIRSRHDPAPARIESMTEDRFQIRFDEPQWAITPGQSAVLYDGEVVLGGGIIATAV